MSQGVNNSYRKQMVEESASRSFSMGMISKAVFHRLRDGTVSKYDVDEAYKVRDERWAILQNMEANDSRVPLAQKKYNEAVELSYSIKTLYDRQGTVESSKENWKDWYNGSGW
jgi:hypothetical protein